MSAAADAIREDFEKTLAMNRQPLDNYSAGLTQLALSDRQRRQEETAAESASKRRMREFTEQERQRLIQKYAELGVAVKGGDTIEEANAKYRAFESNRASNMLDNFTNQLTDNAEQKQSTIADLQRLATKQADPIVQREALTVTLANPAAVKDIPTEQLQKLKAVLNGPGDPAKVVQKVYDYMQNDYWFRRGAAQNKASAFYQTYLTELNSRLDKSKQIDASLLMNRLNDLDRSGQDMLHQRDIHIAGSSAFLTKDQIKSSHEAHPLSVPANPADAFKDVGGTPAPDNADQALGPPGPVGGSDGVTASGGVGGPGSSGEAFDIGGLPGMIRFNRQRGAERDAADLARTKRRLAGVGDAFRGVFMDAPSTNAPTSAEVLANRARVDATLKPIVPASPAEAEAVKRMALQMGISQQDIDTADQQLKNGTAPPNTVKVHNMLIMKVRQQGGGVSGMGMPTNAPAAGMVMPVNDVPGATVTQ